MSTQPNYVTLKYHHHGWFCYSKGKTSYEDGALLIEPFILRSKITYTMIIKKVQSLMGSEDFEVWYQLHGRTLSGGRRRLLSHDDMPFLLESKDMCNAINMYVSTGGPRKEVQHTPKSLIPKKAKSVAGSSSPLRSSPRRHISLNNEVQDKIAFIASKSSKTYSCPQPLFTSSSSLQTATPHLTKQQNIQLRPTTFTPERTQRSVEAVVDWVIANDTQKEKVQAQRVCHASVGSDGSFGNATAGKSTIDPSVKSKKTDKERKGGEIGETEEFSSDSELSDLDITFEVNEEDNGSDDDLFDANKNHDICGSVKENLRSIWTSESNPGLAGVDKLYVVVESDVSCDSDDSRSKHGSDDDVDQYPFFNPEIDLNKPIELKLGLKFPSVVHCRQALRKHAIEQGYDYYYLHNGSKRVSIYCKYRCSCEWDKKRQKLGKCSCDPEKVKCKFKVYATKVKLEETFQIKNMNLKHGCGYSKYNKKVDAEFLANKYLEDWRIRPSWKLREFQAQIARDLMVEVNYTKCWRARARAKLLIHGSGEDEYKRVWDYVAAIKKYNPGSSAYAMCAIIERPIPCFQRMYICLQSCKEGFLNGCRPIVGVDGCHLKGAYPGMCLVAVGKDGNNNIFPIAWGVVEVETVDTWIWFIDLLLSDIGGENGQGEGLTLISDRQKGIKEAFATVAPKADIRFCVRHIWANFKTRFKGQSFKDSFWKAARATSKIEFDGHMTAIKFLDEYAFDYLKEIDDWTWSRHAFTTKAKSNMMLNNLCETFNAVLKDCRDKPILTHMEWMRKYVMKRSYEKRQGVEKYDGRFMPYVAKHFKWAHNETRFCTTRNSSVTTFEVDHYGDTHTVDLATKTCSCYHWDLTGLPCPHAFACILLQRGNPEDYVDEVYSKATYMKAYAPIVGIMPGPKLWEKTDIQEPLPPPFRKLPGRPSNKKRKKEAGEGQVEKNNLLKRVKKPNKCGKCGQLGHNKKTCKNQEAATQAKNKGGRSVSTSAWATIVREKKLRKQELQAQNAAYIASLVEQQSQPCSSGFISGPQTQQSQVE